LGEDDLPPSMKKHQQALIDGSGTNYKLARIMTIIMGFVALVMVFVLLIAEIFFVRQ
jgi:hypothetical protein